MNVYVFLKIWRFSILQKDFRENVRKRNMNQNFMNSWDSQTYGRFV